MYKIAFIVTYTLILVAIGYFLIVIYVLSGGTVLAVAGIIGILYLVFHNDQKGEL